MKTQNKLFAFVYLILLTSFILLLYLFFTTPTMPTVNTVKIEENVSLTLADNANDAIRPINNQTVSILKLIENQYNDTAKKRVTVCEIASLNKLISSDSSKIFNRLAKSQLKNSFWLNYQPETYELSEEYISNKFDELKALYPDGKYWNHGGITSSPCPGHRYGCPYCNAYESKAAYVYRTEKVAVCHQCLGFSCLCSDYIFGKNAPVTIFEDFNKVQPGDLIRYGKQSHSMIVIEKYSDYVIVGECNSDYKHCKITWGRKITQKELSKMDTFYITRRG